MKKYAQRAPRRAETAVNAMKAVGSIIQAANGDIAVYRTQTRKGELEYHVNPVAIGAGLLGVGLAAWLLQLRLNPETYVDANGKTQKRLNIEQRQGFLGNGEGTALGPLSGNINQGVLGSVGIGHGVLFAPFDWLTKGL